ncbi:MAG TPA: hypothetical protein VGE32_00940 [Cellvibrio sp.]
MLPPIVERQIVQQGGKHWAQKNIGRGKQRPYADLFSGMTS